MRMILRAIAEDVELSFFLKEKLNVLPSVLKKIIVHISTNHSNNNKDTYALCPGSRLLTRMHCIVLISQLKIRK